MCCLFTAITSKKYRAVLFTAVFFLSVMAALMTPRQAWALTRCCPQEFSRCDQADGSDRVSCLRHGHANLVPIDGTWGDRNWCGNGDFSLGILLTSDQVERSFDCEAGIPVSDLKCEWTSIEGNPMFCSSVEREYRDHFQNGRVAFACIENCGGAALRWASAAFGTSYEQYANISDYPVSEDSHGRVNICLGGQLDRGVRDAIEDCLRDNNIACAVGAIEGAVVGVGVGSGVGYTVTVPSGALAGCAAVSRLNEVVQSCIPKIMGRVALGEAGACAATFEVQIVEGELSTNLQNRDLPFNLCRQIPAITPEHIDALVSRRQPADQARVRQELSVRRDRLIKERRQCCSCSGGAFDEATLNCAPADGREGAGIYTAVGCIPSSSAGIVRQIVTIALGISGGVALLIILAGSFMMATSQGEPKRAQQAKEMISAAITGLLFIIFSVSILQFIGLSVFRIPGFG